jgi:hypothetical protein
MKAKDKTYLSDLARKVIDDYPDVKADQTRARILLKLHPDKFDDLENARSVVRFVTGNQGKKNRERVNNSDYRDYLEYPPLPKEAVAPPLVNNGAVKLDHERMVVWNDLHGPWFDMDAINWALKNSDADVLYLNGDVVDFYWLSRFLKESHINTTFVNELESINIFFQWLHDKFDTIYYKLANHEDRLPHYLVSKSPEITRLKELQAENLLHLKDFNIKVIGTHQHAEIGDLDVLHGHEIRVSGSVNLGQSIAKAWQGYKGRMDVKVLAAHHHIVNYGVINNPDGSKAYGFVNGCLCQRSVSYSPKNRWQHSITHTTQTSKGTEVEILVK